MKHALYLIFLILVFVVHGFTQSRPAPSIAPYQNVGTAAARTAKYPTCNPDGSVKSRLTWWQTDAAGDGVGLYGCLVLNTWTKIGGSFSGTIAATQVAFGTGVDTIGGDAAMTWDNTTKQLQLTRDTALRIYGTAGSFFSNNLVELRSQGYANSSYLGVGDGGGASMGIFTGVGNGGYLRIANQSTANIPFHFYTGAAPTTHFLVLNQSATTVGLAVKLAAAPTGNAIEVRPNASDTPLFSISSTGKATFDATITAVATTGDQTINKPSGTVNFAAAATNILVTNSTVLSTSLISCTVQSLDTTAISCRVTDKAVGSFRIRVPAATAETAVAFWVYN